MLLWHIGNTTVRTPYRLRDALRVLQYSPLHGNISGRNEENAFAKLLHREGVVDASRVERGEDAADLGRKWRSALSQLGFITPQFTKNKNLSDISRRLPLPAIDIEEISNCPFVITPNGHRLIEASTIANQQDCFLRSLAIYRIPSLIETNYRTRVFSPLRFVLKIFYSLSEAKLEPKLSFHEFALFVQTFTPNDGVESIVQYLKEYRQDRSKARGNVKQFDRNFYEAIAKRVNRKSNTLKDYADLSFRYLKATGLFRDAGRGIVISPPRFQFVELLRETTEDFPTPNDYFLSLWKGATLPTDNAANSLAIIQDLAAKFKDRDVEIKVPAPTTSLDKLEKQRYLLEEQYQQLDELEYADQQSEYLEEILAWIKAILSPQGRSQLPNGSMVSIPKGEGPAYLEWVVWRALLAIDSLCNKPWEARRFHIDQDFLPVHCAPGNGPDMVFEFEDAVIVVEVTLTSSSRQEAVEGEPVRRHVAQFAEHSPKPVYGLFIAAKIDSNTANTFRSGDWFLKDGEKINLSIVPMTLSDFSEFLSCGKGQLSKMPQVLKQLIIECRSLANQEAPAWKKAISQTVRRVVNTHRRQLADS